MIARLTVATPFPIYVPEGAQYKGYSYEVDGYEVIARPPVKTDIPLVGDAPENVTIDGVSAFAANALQFDFRRDTFDRRREGGKVDPPIDLIQRVVASFVSRLRYVARAAHVQPIDFPTGSAWRIQYLSDEGTELPEDEKLVRGLSSKKVSVSFVSLPPKVWDSMFELDSEWRPPVWDDIYLDAIDSAPDVGTSVVLAATSLEVFIADILERLQATSPLPPDVWDWINKRDNRLKEPSTEEQFDVLLRHFVGHSLKDEPTHWEAFKNLRQARNTFVHEGTARIGNNRVDTARARSLVKSARDIMKTVRTWLPEEVLWEEVEPKIELQFTIPLLQPRAPGT